MIDFGVFLSELILVAVVHLVTMTVAMAVYEVVAVLILKAVSLVQTRMVRSILVQVESESL